MAPKAPAKKAPAKKPDVEAIRATAEAAELEVQATIEDAAVNGWQPVHVERCTAAAREAAKARKQLGEQPAGHTTRFL